MSPIQTLQNIRKHTHKISSSVYLLGTSGEILDRNRAPPHTANRASRITMMQPSTAPTTVAVMFVSLVVVGVSKSSDLIEAQFISVVLIEPSGHAYLADTQQS